MDCKLDVVVYNHLDTFFGCTLEGICIQEKMINSHTLFYIVEGEVITTCKDKRMVFKEGDAFFLRRDHMMRITKQPSKEGGKFRAFYFQISTADLKSFITKRQAPISTTLNPRLSGISYMLLPKHAILNGLFLSFRHYFETQTYPSEEHMQLKLEEAILALLEIEPALAGILFDFAEPWKINLADFMNKYYKCDLTLTQFANFTGRSLTTFKRDFEHLFSETPNRWIVKQRLKEAFTLINSENCKPSDVYLKVGFKNLSHFSTAFKKEFGYPPSALTLQQVDF